MIININTNTPYNVYVEKGVLGKVGEILSTMYKAGTKVMIVSDSNVFPMYGARLTKSLNDKNFVVSSFVFEAGEQSKTGETVTKIYEALAENEFTRTDIILNLGGGVAGDMGGYAAATFLRGIDYVQVPTSLLAQVDSSVGGKTGIDLPFGKNLVGAFHQPKAVISDPDVLKSLPKTFFVDGMGEVVKYGCIADEKLFEDLESGVALRNMEDTIIKCILCKKSFVEEDTADKGRRMILNFGHTFGHALEKLHGFSDLSHGRAVAVGMVMIASLGESMQKTNEGVTNRLKDLLDRLELPTEDLNFTNDQILEATALDKKSDGKKINLIFISDIGKSFIHSIEKNYLVLLYKIAQEKKNRGID